MENNEKELQVIEVQKGMKEVGDNEEQILKENRMLLRLLREERKMLRKTKKGLTIITLIFVGVLLFALGIILGRHLQFLYLMGC